MLDLPRKQDTPVSVLATKLLNTNSQYLAFPVTQAINLELHHTTDRSLRRLILITMFMLQEIAPNSSKADGGIVSVIKAT